MRRLLAAVVAGLLLAGCGDTGGRPNHAYDEISSRRNVVREVGDYAILASDDGTVYLRFALVGTRLDPECASPYGEPPMNGHYLALDFMIETYPELAQAYPPEFWISEYDFSVFSLDGVRLNDPIGNTFGCRVPSSEELPSSIGPGEIVRGTILLDVADTTGLVAFKTVGTAHGVEWQY